MHQALRLTMALLRVHNRFADARSIPAAAAAFNPSRPGYLEPPRAPLPHDRPRAGGLGKDFAAHFFARRDPAGGRARSRGFDRERLWPKTQPQAIDPPLV